MAVGLVACSRQNPFSIIVAVDVNNKASGQLFVDDGHSLSGPQDGTLLSLSFDQVCGCPDIVTV